MRNFPTLLTLMNVSSLLDQVVENEEDEDDTNEEMENYRAPFTVEEDRQTMLNWPRQIPIAGEPAHIVALVQAYADWLSRCPLPKLFVNAEPGSILVGAQREFCRTWPNQTEVTVRGTHFIQEDSGAEIGRAVASWMATF